MGSEMCIRDRVLRSTELLSTPITGYLQGLPLHCRHPTYIHTYIIIMVLSNLSVSDVSIYFVWLSTLLVVRDELEHLWRAISCCRLNRSPQVSHLNGSFARSATVILLLTVPHCGIRLLCRFKSCGRLNCFPHRSQDICKASLSTAVILRLFVICSIVVVIISSASRLPALTFSNPSGCSVCAFLAWYLPSAFVFFPAVGLISLTHAPLS